MESEDTQTKLRAARQFFEDAVDHTRDSHAEAHRAERFYHNTRGEGQWESGDLQYLRDEGRYALTFNIVKDKVDSFLGIYADAQRTPKIAGTGAEDQLLGDTIDIVKDQLLEMARYEQKSAAQLKTGSISGECALQIEVVPSNKGRGWIGVNLHRILAFELHWDASSIEADRSDARHVFWDRWLSKAEFTRAYPDKAKEWETLSRTGEPYEDTADGIWSEQGGEGRYSDEIDDYDNEKFSRYYFDRQKHKVRVIRYEYKTYVDKFYAIDERSGDRAEIQKEQVERIEQARDLLGAPFDVETVKEEVVKVCEFVGSTILAEFDSAGPFDGFSIVPYCYMIDEEEGVAYGLVRNLFDPQMELNKSKSLEIEHIAQSTAPGVTAEEGAIPDQDAFSAAKRMPGGVAFVKKGALIEGSVRDDVAQPPSVAVIQRAATALELMDRISGIPGSGDMQPASQAEAATTVALRYHKSRQVVQDPISNYEFAQEQVIQKIAEVISKSMPDDQIESMVGNDSKYVVGNGMIVEMVEDPNAQDGQMVPRNRASLRDLRNLEWNIEMEHSSDNSTLRMLELDTAIKMMAAGVPYDPEVMVELSTGSRATRERLKSFISKQAKASAEAAQREAQTFQEQTQMLGQIEQAKISETSRHNQVQEAITATKNQSDLEVDWATLWEKADEAEKRMIMESIRESQRQQSSVMGAR